MHVLLRGQGFQGICQQFECIDLQSYVRSGFWCHHNSGLSNSLFTIFSEFPINSLILDFILAIFSSVMFNVTSGYLVTYSFAVFLIPFGSKNHCFFDKFFFEFFHVVNKMARVRLLFSESKCLYLQPKPQATFTT